MIKSLCELEDGVIKQVKEYKYILEKEYKPIDEIRRNNE